MTTSPYAEAYEFATRGYSTSGSQAGMIKLLLSLNNESAAFPLSECVREFDSERCLLAQQVIAHYFKVKADEELWCIGVALAKKFPDIWKQGCAGDMAKYKFKKGECQCP